MDKGQANFLRQLYFGGGLAGAIIGAGGQIQSGFADYYQNKYAAAAALNNAELTTVAAQQENKYLMAAALSRQKQLDSQTRQLTAAQKAAVAASGFDISAGEERLIDDTKDKAEQEKRLLLQNALNRSFENTRAAKLNAVDRELQAKLNRQAGKYARIGGFINAGFSALAAGTSLMGNYAAFSDRLPKGTAAGAGVSAGAQSAISQYPWAPWNNQKSYLKR